MKREDSFSAYWFTLDATGEAAIDAILREIASAGKSYHNTEEWTSTDYGPSHVERIQEVANAAASELERVRKENVWRPAEEAPRDVPLIVRTERGRVFRACIRFIDADMGWTWCSFEDGDPIPEDWHDDVCWTENADGESSDWPVEFLPLPPQAKGE